MKVLLDRDISTDYGLFEIVWHDGTVSDDTDAVFSRQVNGIVGAASSKGVYMHFGQRSGATRVHMVLSGRSPGDIRLESEWEDVVEVSFTVPTGADPRWVTWGGESSGDLPDLRPGTYRMRASERGRDLGQREGRADDDDGVVDFFFLQIWPQPTEPDAILRVGSEDARYFHREWGHRRDC